MVALFHSGENVSIVLEDRAERIRCSAAAKDDEQRGIQGKSRDGEPVTDNS